jgi:hypothetical protein
MTAPMPGGISIGRLDIGWRVEADPGAVGRARLDGLTGALSEGALEQLVESSAALQGLRHEEICIRRVVAKPFRTSWATPDSELVGGWAEAISDAIAEASQGRGADVLRYASRHQAAVDLVVSLVNGDRQREWAWSMLGLPSPSSSSAPDAVREVVARCGAERPGELVSMLVEVARKASVRALVTCIGVDLLEHLVAQVWHSAGGTPSRVATDAGALSPDRRRAERVDAYAALVTTRSEIWAASIREGAAGPGFVAADQQLPEGESHAPATSRLMTAIARLSLAEVEPAAVPMALADPIVSALERIARAGVRTEARRPDVGRSSSAHRPTEYDDSLLAVDERFGSADRGAGTAGHPTGTHEGRMAELTAADPEPSASQPTQKATVSAWGGLLFLLHLIGASEFPARVAEDPETYGYGTKLALRILATALIRLAAPELEPDPEDPAVLAFSGLMPGTEPGDDAGPAPWVEAEVGSLVGELRRYVEGEDDSGSSGQGLLLRVLRRRARISTAAGLVDAEFDLDDVDIDVRRAGLDIDPGYVPWLGVFVRFRYV